MNDRFNPKAIEPSDTEGDVLKTQGGKTVWGPPDAAFGVPTIILETGQTVAQYETANGVTLGVPTIIMRK